MARACAGGYDCPPCFPGSRWSPTPMPGSGPSSVLPPPHTLAQPCPTPFQSRAPQSWNPHHITPATHLLPPPLLCIHLLNHSQSTRTPAPNPSPPPAGLPCCSEPGFCGACLGPSPETQPLHGTVTHLPPGPISRKGSPSTLRVGASSPSLDSGTDGMCAPRST